MAEHFGTVYIRCVARAKPNFARSKLERQAPVIAPWRLLVMVLCLLAATIQGYVVQTHGHPAAGSRSVPTAYLTSGVSAVPAATDTVSNDSPLTQPSSTVACPICQAGLSGVVPLPAAIPAVAVSALIVSVPVSRSPALLISAVSYSWQSRGPPLI